MKTFRLSRFVALTGFTLSSILFAGIAAGQTGNIVETATAAGNFNTLLTAAGAADLAGALSGPDQLTVFAPTDEAFAKLDPQLLQSLLQPENKQKLAAILTFHIVPGRVAAGDAYDLRSARSLQGQRLDLDLQNVPPQIENANVVATDIQCTNGVIHVIDEVMLPSLKDIPTVATEAGSFQTLLAAVGAAGLADVLGSDGPFTVFAPTDDAFAGLPAGTVESLLKPENKQQLVDILKYHVISGRVYDNDAVRATSAATLSGRSVSIGFAAAGIQVNEATVLAKNIEASNGVIHVIDRVLIPRTLNPADAMGMLDNAVARGAEFFNNGHHGQCCDVYMQTMTTLMDSGITGANDHTMQFMQNTIGTANSMHSDTDRAWALRHGIDQLHAQLRGIPFPTGG